MAETGAVIDVTDKTFNSMVLESEIPVIVEFWAEWCMPCRRLAPELEKLAKEYEGRAVIAKLNVDENPQITALYGVMGIPTIIVIQSGQEVARYVGVGPRQIREEVMRLI